MRVFVLCTPNSNTAHAHGAQFADVARTLQTAVYVYMYDVPRFKTTHAQSVCTRPFSRGEGPGDEARYSDRYTNTINVRVRL